MFSPLVIVGAPTSAGAYAPGQEQAPARRHGIDVEDRGDVSGFRWRVDKAHPPAMNVATVARVARATADHVAAALARQRPVLVLGGDCTVELCTVAGALAHSESVG